MFKIATEAQIRAAEQEASDNGLAYDDMMQRAGRVVATRALALVDGVERPQLTALIGPGNNGGDGLIAALFIAQDRPQALVRLYLLRDRPDDPFLSVAREAGLFIASADNDFDKRLLRNMVASSDLVIDALFGLGVRLPLRDEAHKVLRAARQALSERRATRPDAVAYDPADLRGAPRLAPVHVLAVDLPSGVDADSGKVDAAALPADETVSFIAARRAHVLGEAVNITGRLTLADLGFSPRQKTLATLPDSLLDADAVRALLPARSPSSHKGTYGQALIVGGSASYYGAPLLAARAAYAVGAGLVQVLTEAPIVAALAAHLPEAIWGIHTTAADAVVAEAHAAAIGMGLGQREEARSLLLRCLGQRRSTPTVIDADALNLLAQMADWTAHLPASAILTPHPAEMARLLGITTAEVQADRLEIARRAAAAWGAVVVLKGAHTVVAAPDGTLTISPFKTDALAKAGTGDALAGMIAGLLAQGLSPVAAGQAACYLHGAAARHLADAHSSRSITASQVIAALSDVLRLL